MKMEELQGYYADFTQKQIGSSIPEFIEYVRRRYSEAKKGGVVKNEVREEHARLKRIEEFQREVKAASPEDFDNN
jgi:hypothetical protein